MRFPFLYTKTFQTMIRTSLRMYRKTFTPSCLQLRNIDTHVIANVSTNFHVELFAAGQIDPTQFESLICYSMEKEQSNILQFRASRKILETLIGNRAALLHIDFAQLRASRKVLEALIGNVFAIPQIDFTQLCTIGEAKKTFVSETPVTFRPILINPCYLRPQIIDDKL